MKYLILLMVLISCSIRVIPKIDPQLFTCDDMVKIKRDDLISGKIVAPFIKPDSEFRIESDFLNKWSECNSNPTLYVFNKKDVPEILFSISLSKDSKQLTIDFYGQIKTLSIEEFKERILK